MDWVLMIIYYCLTGIIILSVVYLSHRFSEKKSEGVHNILASIQGQINRDYEKTLEEKVIDFIVPIIGSILIIAVWPIVPILKLKDLISSRDEPTVEVEEEFAVKEGNLVAQLSIEQIEANENVVDPLKAVPNLPFGHLNSVWRSFLDNMEEDDQIWSFSADWEDWQGKETRRGYVLVRKGDIQDHMLTEIDY